MVVMLSIFISFCLSFIYFYLLQISDRVELSFWGVLVVSCYILVSYCSYTCVGTSCLQSHLPTCCHWQSPFLLPTNTPVPSAPHHLSQYLFQPFVISLLSDLFVCFDPLLFPYFPFASSCLFTFSSDLLASLFSIFWDRFSSLKSSLLYQPTYLYLHLGPSYLICFHLTEAYLLQWPGKY